jgi:hypothetical protein
VGDPWTSHAAALHTLHFCERQYLLAKERMHRAEQNLGQAQKALALAERARESEVSGLNPPADLSQ